MTKTTTAGTPVKYHSKTDGTTGVTAGGTEAEGTYKSFDGFEFSPSVTTANKKGTTTVTDGGENLVELFYNKKAQGAEVAFYKVNYYIWDSVENDYVLKESTSPESDYVGVHKKVTDVEPEYNNKYPGYMVDDNKRDTYTVTLAEAGKTYEMDVYYVPEEPGYILNYYKFDPNTEQYVYVERTDPKAGDIGTTYHPENADPDFEDKYEDDNYTYNEEQTEKAGRDSVKILDTDETYYMNVYYDPPKTTYRTEYYLQQPDGTYKRIDSDTEKVTDTYVGKDVDANIKSYEGYVHTTTDETKETATVEPDGATVMKVYYKYAKDPTYTVQYYIQQPDGTYKLYTEKTNISGTTGENVTAEIISIDAYTHTTTPESKESGTVLADSSTVLKVYYNQLPTTPTEQETTEPTTESTTQPDSEDDTYDDEDDEDDDEDDDKKQSTTAERRTTNSAKTGDETNPILLFIIMLSSVTGGFVLYFRKKEDE